MKHKLLVADDEAAIVNLIESTLDSLGAEVVSTTDSEVALIHVEKERFDGVFLDIRMPVLDGIELTKRIRASFLNAKVPIVILTGQNDADTMREAFRAGATCFLGKPFTRDRLKGLYAVVCGPILLERRRHARLPFQTRVKCTWEGSGEKCLFTDSLNIGEGGMLLRPLGGVEVGQELNLELAMPSAKSPVTMRAKIVTVESSAYMGVEFIDTSITAREAIQSFIVGVIQG